MPQRLSFLIELRLPLLKKQPYRLQGLKEQPLLLFSDPSPAKPGFPGHFSGQGPTEDPDFPGQLSAGSGSPASLFRQMLPEDPGFPDTRLQTRAPGDPGSPGMVFQPWGPEGPGSPGQIPCPWIFHLPPHFHSNRGLQRCFSPLLCLPDWGDPGSGLPVLLCYDPYSWL